MPRLAAILPLLLALLASPALAQDRPPDQRQALLDLSYAIGQSHAYRQDCEGAGDQYWRTRMLNLVETEHADPVLEARMKTQFNAGFAAAQAAQLSCAASHAAASAVARKGQAAAAALASAMLGPAPPPATR